MQNIHVIFTHTPGELARFGQVLGANGVGLEGGGVFAIGDCAHAHFLVEDGEKAQAVLMEHGFDVQSVTRPLIRKLKQEQPGELGAIAQALAAEGINILVQYSDHANQLILVTDNDTLAKDATRNWAI
ncbi:amino acid-binding protein [Vibrio fluvialis]